MKNKLIQRMAVSVSFSFAVALLASGWNAHAATDYVLNGDDFQQDINNAAPGDTLVVQPGIYYESLVFNKPLTVLRGITDISNQPVNLAGTVQIQGPGTNAFQQITFENTVGVQGPGTVSFVGCLFQNPINTTNATLLSLSNTFQASVAVDLSMGATTNLQAYDTSFVTLAINGGKAILKRCNITGSLGGSGSVTWFNQSSPAYGLSLTGTALEAIRLTNIYGINATAGGGMPVVIVQSQLSSSVVAPINFTSNNVWLGYNSIFAPVNLSGCNSVLIGNSVWTGCVGFSSGLSSWLWIFGDIYCIGGTLKAYNNLFGSFAPTSGYSSITDDPVVGLSVLAGGGAELVNNTLYQSGNDTALSADNNFPVTLRGDAIYGSVSGGSPSPLWDISYCVFNDTPGVGAPFACIVSDPGFVNPNDSGNPSDFKLQTNSVCIGNGSPWPIYYNRGTTNRNDIGFTGGPFYNPANSTNLNPMVYLLTGTPLGLNELRFPIGRTNIMALNAAAAAGN